MDEVAELDPLDHGDGNGATAQGRPRSCVPFVDRWELPLPDQESRLVSFVLDRGEEGGDGLVCVSTGISLGPVGIAWQLMRRGERASSTADRLEGGAEVERLGDMLAPREDMAATRAAGVPGSGGGGACPNLLRIDKASDESGSVCEDAARPGRLRI